MEMQSKNWYDEQLKALVLLSLAYHQLDDVDTALTTLMDALTLAVQGGIIHVFVDEGQPMQKLLTEAATRGMMPDYIRKLLTVIEHQHPNQISNQPLIEPLSERELEILSLVSEGLSNQEISDKLYLALSTVKGHNRNIFDKLHVKRRTEAVARARELGLI
jgi:LuxR family maltose regulon positive regulatory protein